MNLLLFRREKLIDLEILDKTSKKTIEIQTGGYLGEDDIIRFDDCYGRATSRANKYTSEVD